MSAREQQLEAELALTRQIVIAKSRGRTLSWVYYLESELDSLRRVAAWRPYDD